MMVLCLLSAAESSAGPYPPAAGETGSTAVPSDHQAIVAWASGWEDYVPGPEADAVWQTPDKAVGPPDGTVYDVVCLGRGGRLTMTFNTPISDRTGWDFAVFENGFRDTFLELAYVEVSSDGVNFVRFDSVSLTALPVNGFGAVDPTDVDGLAGKYRLGYGTPFDLSDLAGKPEVIANRVDLTSITRVRFIDIVGDGSCQDTDGRPIHDPYPTYQSAGLDLNAVAVLSGIPKPAPTTTGDAPTSSGEAGVGEIGGPGGGGCFVDAAGGGASLSWNENLK